VPPRGALALLRLGWSYHFGIRRSFLGGAGPTLQQATSLYTKGSDAPYPPVSEKGGGTRYLRHDPITKPIVMLAPDVPVRGKGQRIELQSSAQMVLASRRLSNGGQQVGQTARILVVPPVESHFAAMHEVFDELGVRDVVHDQIFVSKPSKPKNVKIPTIPVRRPIATYAPQQGLKNVKLYYSDAPPTATLSGHHRFEFGSGEQRTGPYYPDPAACFMVLRLQHPELTDVWLSPPLVVRVRGDAETDKRFSWPNLLPVRVDLHRADEKQGEGLKLGGGDIVQDRGQLFRHVTVHLLPGESAVLKAWSAPDAEDLLSWFDVVERSIQLCTSEAKDCKCDPGSDCATGRQLLLGKQSGPLQGNDEDQRHIAGMYHQRLLEEPVFLFSDVATINLVHATDVPWHAASFADTPRVGRPASLDGDQLADFLTNAGPATDWGSAKADDKATAVILGGLIEFDPATTSGLVIEAEMVCPGSGVIDPAPLATPAQFVPNPVKPVKFDGGKPDFGPRVWTEVLRIQGIPLRADGRAGKRQYALEQLMLGNVPEMKTAQFQYGAPLNTGQAREARFRVVPIPRYGPLLSNRSKEPSRSVPAPMLAGLSPPTLKHWIPATIRPAAPDVKELGPIFTWTNSGVSVGATAARATSSKIRSAALRLVLRRPWFSSGEHERVGIVFWPPAVLDLPQVASSGSAHEFEVPSSAALAMLTEEDIGPVGPFASVWGFDPIEAIDTTITTPGQKIVRPRFLSADDFVLPNGAIKHPRVLMPLPGATPGKDDERFVTVSMVSLPVSFIDGDADAHVDLEFIPIKMAPAPVIRLGVVRMQLNARLDEAMTPLVSDPLSQAAIRCSPPVKVQSQLLPKRKLSVTATEIGTKHGAEGDQTSISVTLSGPAAPYVEGSLDTRVTIELVEHVASEEVAVRTVRGVPAKSKGTSKSGGDVYRDYKPGEATWATSFLLPGRLAGRQIVARAREDMVTADADDDSGQPRYFGQVAIGEPAVPD
jgi:hypothetical protein